MAGREIKGGIVIHPVIATAILGVIITLGLAARSEMNWQHDQLVIMTTQKAESEKAADRERQARAMKDSEWDARIHNVEVKLAVQTKEKN